MSNRQVSCPVCGNPAENSYPSNLVEGGTYHRCHACKSDFWIRKEAEA
jgi:formate dehydrogenase maturation protein FdhE